MINFKNYIIERATNSSANIEKYKKELIKLGFEIKDISSKRFAIITDTNRVKVLKDISKKYPGSKYDPLISASSAGGLVMPDGVVILAKPKNNSGSGGGAASTAIVESAQCLYCAAIWYGKSDFSDSGLKAVKKYIDVTEDVEKIIENLNDEWQNSSIATGKELHKKFGKEQYTFHRGSKWVAALEKRFKELNRREKQFSNTNKWSPADIYLVNKTAEKENFKEANSIIELNAILLRNVNEGNIIPVSLKKVGSKTATLKFINQTKNRSTYEIKNPSYSTGKRAFFSSKDVYMFFYEGEIQFRGFNTIGFQGEIKGKYSAHGKIGNGIIKNIIKKITNFEMETAREVSKRLTSDLEAFYKDFHKYYMAVENGKKLNYDKFVAECIKKDEGWHISKYLGVQMLYPIHDSKKIALDAVIGAMIGYAASESELSAVYLKAT